MPTSTTTVDQTTFFLRIQQPKQTGMGHIAFRWMAVACFVLLGLCLGTTTAAAAVDTTDCRHTLDEFVAYSASQEAAPYTGSNMVYFLHIPRTAGRTFYTCLLRHGTPGEGDSGWVGGGLGKGGAQGSQFCRMVIANSKCVQSLHCTLPVNLYNLPSRRPAL